MKKILFVLCGLLLAFDIYLVCNRLSLVKTINSLNIHLESMNSIHLGNVRSLKNDSCALLSENKSLLEEILVADSDGKELFLQKVIEKPVLVLRYFDVNCTSCYEISLGCFKDFSSSFRPGQAIFLADYKNLRDLYHFFRSLGFKCNYYNTNGAKINLPIEDAKVPYAFIIDKDFHVNNVFVIDNRRPELFKSYLISINNIWFKN
jgi:hypothetical protein